MSNIANINKTSFEEIKHIDENGTEYWLARELAPLLDYHGARGWQNFLKIIQNAETSLNATDANKINHFTKFGEMVQAGVAPRERVNYKLSRHACYLIAMNGDSRKGAIALAQNYFAVKTRQQELADNFHQLTEDQKRLSIRNELKSHNSSLAEAAQNAGVTNYGKFQNYGYRGLYGGLDAKDIHTRKGLKQNQNILDHMGSTELAANLFRATQTDEKLRRENVHGEAKANNVHFEVGAKVRQTIQELGGTMPENLPTPNKSIRQIEQEQANGNISLFPDE